jgi:hypothetical protein
MGALYTFRLKGSWSFYPRREKIFHIAAIGFVGLIAVANFNAGY